MSHTELTEAYEVLPLPTPPFPSTPTAGGDTYIQMDKVGTPNPLNNIEILFGKFIDGKFQQELCAFFRFEVDMELGRKISEAVFEYQVFSAGRNPAIKGGFLKPQTSGTNDWQNALGVGEWALDINMPLPMWNEGANVDNTVFHGDNFAFAIPAFNSSDVEDTVVTVGEGSTLLTGLINDTSALAGFGFIAQLQAYLEANESLRGRTVAGSIPVLFCLYLDGNSQTLKLQDMLSQNGGGQNKNLLRIIHDWERLSIASELKSASALEAALTVRVSMAAELSSATSFEADELVVFKPLAIFEDVTVPLNMEDVTVPLNMEDVTVPSNMEDVTVPSNMEDVTVPSNMEDVVIPSDTLDITVEC